jgi:hypothetical protein
MHSGAQKRRRACMSKIVESQPREADAPNEPVAAKATFENGRDGPRLAC